GTRQHRFNYGKTLGVAGIPADLDIVDCISVKPCRFGQVPHSPIQGGSSHPYLCTCHRHYDCAIVTCAFDTTVACRRPKFHGVLMPSNLASSWNRRSFIGGSDARIIMGNDEATLIRLWQEKRGEAEPEDLSGNLIVQLGTATEELNRTWYERNTGRRITD